MYDNVVLLQEQCLLVIAKREKQNYTIFINKFLSNTIHAAERARLSGMVITGSTSSDGKGTELHRDQSNVSDCTRKYTNQAYPVCQDIIAIPISSDQSWQHVKISTIDYLMLCEVEVFAGKPYIKLICIAHGHNLCLLDV